MEAAKNITFNMGDDISLSCMLSQCFVAQVLERGLSEFREYNASSETRMADIVAVIGAVAHIMHWKNARWPSQEQYLFDDVGGADIMVYIQHYAEFGYEVDLAAGDAEKADSLIARIAAALPPIQSDDPTIVPIDFWAQTKTGAKRITRRIVAPAWEELDANYTFKAWAALDAIMGMVPPMDGGKLILWHGLPGTGKSYAIRALMREWRPWCKSHYILDPERFFGEADYMLSVILDRSGDSQGCTVEECPLPASEDSRRYVGPPWNLLVMEDSDEFLQADAKDRQGQSLSRLLNLADGLVGQGLNLLVLITTNEPLGKIHPAVQREGRCMANVEFGKLNAEEVMGWALLRQLSLDSVPAMLGDGGSLLSDLYAKARERPQVKAVADRRQVGFHR